jgi:hypothetical protein
MLLERDAELSALRALIDYAHRGDSSDLTGIVWRPRSGRARNRFRWFAVLGDELFDGADESDPAGERARVAAFQRRLPCGCRAVDAQFEVDAVEAIERIHR